MSWHFTIIYRPSSQNSAMPKQLGAGYPVGEVCGPAPFTFAVNGISYQYNGERTLHANQSPVTDPAERAAVEAWLAANPRPMICRPGVLGRDVFDDTQMPPAPSIATPIRTASSNNSSLLAIGGLALVVLLASR